MTIEGRAPAKLNLTLEALGRRADGYHEIASVMHTLTLCDTLTLELPPPDLLDPACGEICLVEPPDSPPLREAIPTDSRNLVWQAVARFVALTPSPSPTGWERGVGARRATPVPPLPPAGEGDIGGEGTPTIALTPCPSPTQWERGANLPLSRAAGEGDRGGEGKLTWRATLTKRIPSQAGLGGGSSDAALALRLLNQWAARYERALSDDALYALASELGADVAFFLKGGCARATGKGEQLQSLPTLPAFWWVLAKPYGVGIPTGWAYAQLKRGAYDPAIRPKRTERLVRLLPTIQMPRQLAPLLHNDFDAPILRAIPALAELRALLEQSGALRVILCGSGAAQAALCDSEDHAKTLASTLLHQNYWVVWTQM